MIALVSRPDPIRYEVTCRHCARRFSITSNDQTALADHDASHPTCGVCRRARIAEPSRTGSRCDDCWKSIYDEAQGELTDADYQEPA